jgi:hypothetical protein
VPADNNGTVERDRGNSKPIKALTGAPVTLGREVLASPVPGVYPRRRLHHASPAAHRKSLCLKSRLIATSVVSFAARDHTRACGATESQGPRRAEPAPPSHGSLVARRCQELSMCHRVLSTRCPVTPSPVFCALGSVHHASHCPATDMDMKCKSEKTMNLSP